MKKADTVSNADHTPNNYITREELALVLSFIPANLPRDEWAQIAMALKSAGIDFDVFDEWSATGSNYDQKAARDTWKSINAVGGITIKTVFHKAKKYGYDPRQSKANFKPVIELAKRRQAQADKARHEAAKRASKRAEYILNGCAYSPVNHPYLLAKKITPKTKIWIHKNALTIPVMDLRGNIHSLQFIQPSGKKHFLKDGVIKGHFYQIWSKSKPSDAIVICEGYATAVTLACNYTPDCSVVVAFNSGNLKPVANVFRSAFPDARILIAGDSDDVGKKAAFDAAQAVSGDVALPVFLEGENGSDWNDRWLLDGVKYG